MISGFFDLAAQQGTEIQALMGVASVLVLAALFGFAMAVLMTILDCGQQKYTKAKHWHQDRQHQHKLTDDAMRHVERRQSRQEVLRLVEDDQRRRLDACVKIGGRS